MPKKMNKETNRTDLYGLCGYFLLLILYGGGGDQLNGIVDAAQCTALEDKLLSDT